VRDGDPVADPRRRGFPLHDDVDEGLLIQEYVEGDAASASVISTASDARTVAVNEQLLGVRDLGQLEPFGYCGNITPLEASEAVVERCREVAEEVVEHFRLVGSNGVDLVITGEGVPEVIEVNPNPDISPQSGMNRGGK
jgi:predicted ATP-grasp superfamily ATP-dependent carboligase